LDILLAHCNAHGYRQFDDVAENSPEIFGIALKIQGHVLWLKRGEAILIECPNDLPIGDYLELTVVLRRQRSMH
jgi:hypothetical protein